MIGEPISPIHLFPTHVDLADLEAVYADADKIEERDFICLFPA